MNVRKITLDALLFALVPMACACSSNSSKPGTSNSSPWLDHTYLLEIPDSHWTQPPQVGKDIGAYVPKFLLQVKSVSASSIEVLLGTQDSTGAQDPCNPTTLIQGTVQYPQVHLESAEVPLHISDSKHGNSVIANARDFKMDNILPGDGDAAASEGNFSAVVDARELYPMFYLLPDADADLVCTALGQAGGSCTACPQDGAAYCLTLVATQLGASLLDGATVQAVDANVPASCSSDAG